MHIKASSIQIIFLHACLTENWIRKKHYANIKLSKEETRNCKVISTGLLAFSVIFFSKFPHTYITSNHITFKKSSTKKDIHINLFPSYSHHIISIWAMPGSNMSLLRNSYSLNH